MPTPSDDATPMSPPREHDTETASHPSCPPEEIRMRTSRSNSSEQPLESQVIAEYTIEPHAQQPTPPADDRTTRDTPSEEDLRAKHTVNEEDRPIRDTPSPLSASDDTTETDQRASSRTALITAAAHADQPEILFQLLDSPLRRRRQFLPNSTSSFLRHGSKFRGTQKSDRQVYDVQVEIKYVDMAESFMCGYLRIQGLIKDHPTLTTYFEGEIIGNKYTFQTKHDDWGSTQAVDMQHWGRFPAWRPLAKQAKRPDFSYKNFSQRENIFMRWKEYFLVPDHRVKTIFGASFEGFYYICFNQVMGEIEGIYYHSKSEKYQQLKLTHVPDHGCFGAVEFR